MARAPRSLHSARIRRAAFGLLALGAVGSLACEKAIGADFDSPEVVSCEHVSPPPALPISNGGGDTTMTVAASDIDLGERLDPDGYHYRHVGFDLDGVCTNQSQGPACRGVTWTEPKVTDGVDGRDNAVGVLMAQQEPLFGRAVFRSDDLSDGTKKGTVAPIGVFRVAGYNNNADDDQVTVEWFAAATPLDGAAPPAWDDPNHPVDLDEAQTSLDGNGSPATIHRDEHAYVNHHVLVARFPKGPLMRLANVGWHLTDAVLVAPIDQKGIASQPNDVVTLAGRMSERELFARLPDVTAFVAGLPICKSNPNYATVKKYVCSVIDLRLEGNDPTQPCDALTFALSFHVKAAALGALRPSKPEVRCAAGDDPKDDDCSTPPPGGVP